MPADLPLISVVVPSFNQGRFLRANLDSIFGQDYPHLEVIVMDGGSTDESLAVIEAYAPRLKYWRSAPDGGQSAAINEGMRHCTGALVAWLNSDDFYWRDSLWTVGRAWAAHPGYGLYLGNGLRFDDQRQCYSPFHRGHMALNRQALEEGLDYLLQPSAFFARAAWEEQGGLDPKLRYCMDWDLLIRIARRHPAVMINEFLAVSREHAETKTSTGRIERAFEIARMIRGHTGQEMTSGTLFYLLETLLGVSPTPARGPLYGAMKALQAGWQQQWGSAAGFPHAGDPQDVTYIPFVAGAASVGQDADAGSVRDGPRVSVIIPSYNQAGFLSQTLDSLIGQRYPNLETIVIDGASTDGCQDILRRYERHLAAWVSEPDRGPAHAINKGFARATGEILAWLGSDDLLTDGALAAAARLFADDPDLDLVYANAVYIDQHNQPFLANHGGLRTALYYGDMQPAENIPAYWSYVHAVPQPTVFFRRRLLERCGSLDESYQFIFDFELFHRFARVAKVKKLERTQALYRIHPDSKTSSWSRFLVELYRFSRPHWPGRLSPAFKPWLRAFVAQCVARFPHGLANWRRRALAARLRLAAWSGWGNPEAMLNRRVEAAAASKPKTPGAAPGADARGSLRSPRGVATPIDRRGVLYESFFCSPYWPLHPGHSGGEIRDFHLMRHLLSLSRVTYYGISVPRDDRADLLAPHMEGIHTLARLRATHRLGQAPVPRRAALRRLVDWLQRRGYPVLGARYHADGDRFHGVETVARVLQAEVDGAAPDFLFVSPQHNPIALLTRAGPKTRLILASYDVEAVRVERLGASRGSWLGRYAGRLEARRAARFEADNLRRFDGVIAVSDLDKALFVERYGIAPERVLVVPNGIDPEYFAFAPRPAHADKIVLFTASFNYPPNHQAALRLIESIMPRVRQTHPTARALLVGQNPAPELLAKHDGAAVIVTGKVDDVRPYLAQASISCVPLLAGSGTKYKVLESLSAGVPVVCSPVGAEGLDLVDGEHLLVGDTDADISAAIDRLLSERDLAQRLAQRGRQRVVDGYTWDANLARLGPWLAELLRMPAGRVLETGAASSAWRCDVA